MCDTLFLKNENGFVFGKNSDRSANEPNLTVFSPARINKTDFQECTYIKVKEARECYATLLVKPSWMWGAEMGINSYGVIIGNEAVFTKSKGKKKNGLLGMDYIRLALEHSKTSIEAKNHIISLLKEYGQSGNCGFDKSFYYDNSYLIADDENAFILETAGKEYVIKNIETNGNISNRLSIDEKFKRKNIEPIFSFFSGSKTRLETGKQMLNKKDFNLEDMMEILRSHNKRHEKTLYTKGSLSSICMHSSLLGDHTTGSFIVEKKDDLKTIWVTGCSTPCLSVYKPVFFDDTVPPVFETEKESLKYWLNRECLVRCVYAGIINSEELKNKISNLEQKFIKTHRELTQDRIPTKKELHNFSLFCSRKEQELVNGYDDQIKLFRENKVKLPVQWQKKSKALGINVFERELTKRGIK